MTTRLSPWLAGPVLLLGLGGSTARAGPDDDVRRAERALAVGDVSGLDGNSGDSGHPTVRALVWLRDAFWRPVPPGDPSLDASPATDSTAAARARWLVARLGNEPSIKTPEEQATDPFPLLSALVLDRHRRERQGIHSTRTEGPLTAVGTDEYIAYFLDSWVDGAYGGPAAIPERRGRPPDSTLRDEANRNRWVALAAVVGLAVFAAMGGIILGGRPRRPREPT